MSTTHTLFASSCVDITKNLFRRDENSDVLLLQNFLSQEGYLKATPNGYYGAGTFAAVRGFQKDNGISQTGAAGRLTRAKIKSITCTSQTTTTTSPLTNKTVTAESVSKTVAVIPQKETITTKPLSHNEVRFRDSERILVALYNAFKDRGGVWPVAISTSSPLELCVEPRRREMEVMAFATDTAQTVKTPDSKCKEYIDVSYLEPNYFSVTPRDPSLSTSSIALGYTISRGEYGDITIAPKKTDNGEHIKVRCSFNGSCKSVTRLNKEEYNTPYLERLQRNTFIADSIQKEGVIIYGRNLNATNTLIIQSKTTQRIYTAQASTSVDIKNRSTQAIIPASITRDMLSCGVGCREKLPVGDYSLQVSNEGGKSDFVYFSVRAFTTSTLSLRANTSAPPNTNSVKLATVSVSSGVPLVLKSLVLTSSTTPFVGTSTPNTASKITNFKLIDAVSGSSITGSGLTFTLGDIQLIENSSRFYDISAAIGDILVQDSAFMTYGGKFVVKDTLTGAEFDLPIKEFSFSVSP
ncbi:MAG: hypothetical protein RI935_265 [Candidatus Parcubacteria bacterium]